MSTRAVPLAAARLEGLSGKNGGVFATALAVWVSQNWRDYYGWGFAIDEKQARKEHRDILRGMWRSSLSRSAVTRSCTLRPSNSTTDEDEEKEWGERWTLR